uniref:EMI domain-containing protein n=2 Tax=Arion vulgaris TaxID=1028688 RepID=A0A0B7A1D5_9EUPU
MSFLNQFFIFIIIFICSSYVSCNWCTRITSENHVYTITETSKCNQSYQDYCHLLTWELCTYNDLVTCFKERNHTMVQYKTTEECCPGYWQNNGTCVKITGVVKNRTYTAQYYKLEDELLFGLSPGAYAGILSAFIFVTCVFILIIVHIMKRKRKSSAVKQDTGVTCEMTEKMFTQPQA